MRQFYRAQSTSVYVRYMIPRDVPSVLAIEEASFECPWNEEEIHRFRRQLNAIPMVAQQDDRVVGFMMYELHPKRLHVLNLAVDPVCRRSSIGTSMVEKLCSKLSHDRRNRIMIEVRERNLEAQLFLKQMGFKAISVLRDFYEDITEDAYLMQYRYQETR